jgi:elongation factor Ts
MAVEISANQVKELRESSGAGMMECKKALQQAQGDMKKAMQILRESGAAKAAKREGRTAAEGVIQIAVNADSTAAGIAELNSETDFVARNDEFQGVAKALAASALQNKAKSAESIADAQAPGLGKTAAEAVNGLIAKIGEKITFNRAEYVEGDVVADYIHMTGKIGVVVAAKVEGGNRDKVKDALRSVAMHIAAMSPRFMTEAEVDEASLATEREIAANIARKDGKPENIIPKIVEGKIKAFYKEAVLLDNQFAMDSSVTVRQFVENAAKEAGAKVTLTRFVRFRCGETVQQEAASE